VPSAVAFAASGFALSHASIEAPLRRLRRALLRERQLAARLAQLAV
jgi:hypothetical protein